MQSAAMVKKQLQWYLTFFDFFFKMGSFSNGLNFFL